MITPAIMRINSGVFTSVLSTSMYMLISPVWLYASYAPKEASGTPIKLTKSLPAKAIARAKVPESTITFKILILNTDTSSCETRVKKTKHISISSIECVPIHALAAGGMMVVPFAPLSNK